MSFSLKAEYLFNYQHYWLLRNDWTQSFTDRHQPWALNLTEGPPQRRKGYAGRLRHRLIGTGSTRRCHAANIPWLGGPLRSPKTGKCADLMTRALKSKTRKFIIRLPGRQPCAGLGGGTAWILLERVSFR
jgi:hypothetical protein